MSKTCFEASALTYSATIAFVFDGITFINVGVDDTLRNMRWRLEPYFSCGPAGEIAAEVFARLQEHDTAYSRLRALHHRERNNWWD